MKLKSLLFGSAAVMAVGTGAAQAADLPVAEPVEYVRICDAFGTGFYYLPGTDTCLRVSGQVRVESHFVEETDSDDPFIDREFNNWTTRARGNIRLDARTQTDFGLVRAYIDLQMDEGPSDFTHDYGDGSPTLASAFIQVSRDWGTFTTGHTGSFFDFWGSNTFGTRIAIDDNTTEQTLSAITFNLGNGFSATFSAEDPDSGHRRKDSDICSVIANCDISGGGVPGDIDDYEGQEFPDGVVNLRVDQAWGSAQIMGVVGQIHDKVGTDDNGAGINTEGDDDADEVRWAIGGGLKFNLPFGGLAFASEAGFAHGAIGYISTDPMSRGFFTGFNAGDFVGPEADDSATEAWMARAGLSGKFAPTLTWQVDASFTSIDTDRVALTTGGSTDLDYDFTAVVADLVWEPVPGLIMGPEVGWNRLSFDHINFGGEDTFDVVGAMWRTQRAF
jgi:hypothetical protein